MFPESTQLYKLVAHTHIDFVSAGGQNKLRNIDSKRSRETALQLMWKQPGRHLAGSEGVGSLSGQFELRSLRWEEGRFEREKRSRQSSDSRPVHRQGLMSKGTEMTRKIKDQG